MKLRGCGLGLWQDRAGQMCVHLLSMRVNNGCTQTQRVKYLQIDFFILVFTARSEKRQLSARSVNFRESSEKKWD